MSKGRSKILIEKRDKALCRRYYYWTEVRRLRFDDAIKILSEEEFFLCEQRILKIIRDARRETPDVASRPRRFPRLTVNQLSLFTDDSGFAAAQTCRETRNQKFSHTL
jgi:hypothetical protein